MGRLYLTNYRYMVIKIFTLIELMVIISIISILVTMLLPVLSKVYNTTREMTCRENLRQIGIMMTDYANDHNNGLPNPQMNISINDSKWQNALYYYAAGNNEKFICPDAPENIRSIHDVDGNFYGNGSYGMNVYLYMRPPLSRPSGNFKDISGNWLFIKNIQIIQPSSCILAADSENPVSGTINAHLLYPYSGVGTTSTWGGKLSNRHNNEGYYLWADGHTSALEIGDAETNRNKWFGPQGL